MIAPSRPDLVRAVVGNGRATRHCAGDRIGDLGCVRYVATAPPRGDPPRAALTALTPPDGTAHVGARSRPRGRARVRGTQRPLTWGTRRAFPALPALTLLDETTPGMNVGARSRPRGRARAEIRRPARRLEVRRNGPRGYLLGPRGPRSRRSRHSMELRQRERGRARAEVRRYSPNVEDPLEPRGPRAPRRERRERSAVSASLVVLFAGMSGTGPKPGTSPGACTLASDGLGHNFYKYTRSGLLRGPLVPADPGENVLGGQWRQCGARFLGVRCLQIGRLTPC